MKTNIHLLSDLTHFFLEWEMFRTKFVENIKIHIFCWTTFFLKYFLLWDKMENILERGRTHTKMWRMRIESWIPKATNTHTEVWYAHCFSTATMVTRTSLTVTLYVHCLTCYILTGETSVLYHVTLQSSCCAKWHWSVSFYSVVPS
jgi:hypothetical protein